MDLSWITTSMSAVLMVIISTLGIYAALILFTRIYGVRSFSKMSSFDFAITVAIGTVIASTALTKNPPLLQAIVTLATLYIIQMVLSNLRKTNTFVRSVVDNKPILLMRGDEILEENMKRGKVSRSDLLAKLRAANVTQFSQIKAVVMETTGDISVLHSRDKQLEPDESLFDDLADYKNSGNFSS